jgi:hypothetical protein
VQGDRPLQCVGKVRAMTGLAARERVAGEIKRVRQLIDTGQTGAENTPVADDATHRNAAEADSVITAFAPDQPGAIFSAVATASDPGLAKKTRPRAFGGGCNMISEFCFPQISGCSTAWLVRVRNRREVIVKNHALPGRKWRKRAVARQSRWSGQGTKKGPLRKGAAPIFVCQLTAECRGSWPEPEHR